jgi:sarcosine oxidase subunit gamma
MADTARPLARNFALAEASLPAGGSAVDIRLLPPRARLCLRVAPALLSPAKAIAGFALGIPVNRCAGARGRVAMRLGPDEWQLTCPPGEAAAVAAAIGAELAGRHHALVDISHAQVAFDVAGPRAADVVNAGCPLDLAPRVFAPGHATRTLLGKAEIVLSRPADALAFEIECARSYAAYVRDFLIEAAREHGAAEVAPAVSATGP